ncbi:glycosyltransferase [bacterium]|nr:glycosyltransferase [bacterium]
MTSEFHADRLPAVSIVIPARNSALWIVGCLRSVQCQTYPAEKVQVVVVDNASEDDTAKIAGEMGYDVVACEKPGASAARNLGLAHATAPIIVFLDSDAEAETDWLERLIQAFDSAEVTAVGGRIEPYRLETGAEWHATLCHMLDQERHLAGELPHMLPFLATANAAYRAAALREVGGFDENLSVCEDADLAWRIQWNGGQLAYAEEAVVKHHHRSDRSAYLRQVYSYGQGTVRLFAKHRKRLGLTHWIAVQHLAHLAMSLAALPFAPFKSGKRIWKVMPFYDVATDLCWIAGRIREAIRLHVLVL